MKDNSFNELTMYVIIIVLGIVCIPIFLGMLLALVVNAKGLDYFAIVSFVSCIIWLFLSLYWWL